MKKLLVILIMLFSISGFSQALSDGTYTSTVYNSDYTNSYEFTFQVDGGIVTVDGIDTSDTSKKTLHNNATTVMTWINTGGVWTESQTYVFSKDLKSGKIYLHFYRVVQNEGQLPWNVFMVGHVYRK